MSKPRPRSCDTRDKVRAEFAKLPDSMEFDARVRAAFKKAGITEERKAKYYPSTITWLGASPVYSHARSADTSTAKIPARQPRAPRGSLGAAPEFTLDEAVELLVAIITRRVMAAVEPKLDAGIAARLAKSAVTLAKTPDSGLRTPDSPQSLNDLDDDLLRIKAGVAKERGDIMTWGKCTAVLRRRSTAANNLEVHEAAP